MSKVSEAASWLFWHMITDPRHGYSQPNRWGTGSKENVDVPDWGTVTIADGDRDCASGVISCYKALGINTGYATWTGNMLNGLLSTGLFEEVPLYGPSFDGDILLRKGHTEMILANTKYQAGFRRSETHGINGRTGDQDGYESTYSPLRLSEWEHKIRYYGPDKGGVTTSKPVKKNVSNKILVGDWWGNTLVAMGETGRIVKLIQRALVSRGYSVGAAGVDGVFGGSTSSAVKQYQTDADLTPDAVVGPATAGKLFS